MRLELYRKVALNRIFPCHPGSLMKHKPRCYCEDFSQTLTPPTTDYVTEKAHRSAGMDSVPLLSLRGLENKKTKAYWGRGEPQCCSISSRPTVPPAGLPCLGQTGHNHTAVHKYGDRCTCVPGLCHLLLLLFFWETLGASKSEVAGPRGQSHT